MLRFQKFKQFVFTPKIQKHYMSTTEKYRKIDIAGIFVFSSISLFTFGLGIWQWQRYEGKIELLRNGQQSLAMPPIALSNTSYSRNEISQLIKDNKGHLVMLEGIYDHDNEIFLGPRSLPNSSAQGMSTNPQGYFIITPFRTTDG